MHYINLHLSEILAYSFVFELYSLTCRVNVVICQFALAYLLMIFSLLLGLQSSCDIQLLQRPRAFATFESGFYRRIAAVTGSLELGLLIPELPSPLTVLKLGFNQICLIFSIMVMACFWFMLWLPYFLNLSQIRLVCIAALCLSSECDCGKYSPQQVPVYY